MSFHSSTCSVAFLAFIAFVALLRWSIYGVYRVGALSRRLRLRLRKKCLELFRSQFCVAKDFTHEASSNVLARMGRHSHYASIWMPHPHVTSPLPDDLEACPLQSIDYFTGFQ
jgi:hypothetical protein